MGIDKDSQALANSRRTDNYPAVWPDSTLFGDWGHERGDEGKGIADYLRAVLYRKWIVAGVFVVAVGLASFYASRIIPLYKSTASIEVEKVYPSSANLSELFSFFGQFDLYYQTQLESLKSRTLIEHFIEKMKGTPRESTVNSAGDEGTNQETAAEPDSPEKRKALLDQEKMRYGEVNSILSRINVTPIKNTQLIEIDLTADDPILARKMLGTYIETFIEQDKRKRAEIAGKVKDWLRNELSETERHLNEARTKLLDFTKKNGIVFLSKNQNQAVSEFEKASDKMLQSKDTRMSLEIADKEQTKVLPQQTGNEFLQQLKTQLAALKSEYMGMRTIYTPDYFKMGLLQNRIKSLETAIAEIEKNAVQDALEAAKKKEELTAEAYEKSKEEALEMNSLAVQYEILKRNLEANNQAYILIMQKAKQAELDHGFSGHNISVMSAPTLPLVPINANKSRIILIGAILGLLGGVAVALGLEHFDASAQTPQELEKRLNVRILGAVPRIKNVLGEVDEFRTKTDYDHQVTAAEFMAYEYPKAPFTDAIRIIQNAAANMMAGEPGATMCVTSALPLEGKTLIAVVMGTVVASESKRVLVIDGDMRRPRIHQVFKCRPDSIGLSDLITGKCTEIRQAIQKSKVPGLYYMTSGSLAENPVALLKSGKTQEIVHACKKAFDFVIFDAPPLLGLVDANIISAYADGLILVAKAGHTPLDVLRQAKESVFRGQGKLLGIVLNMADEKLRGYGAYGYGPYGYGYGYGYHQYGQSEKNRAR
jgi:polysaccharide biosynthesis transport protein